MKAKVKLYKTDGQKEKGYPVKVILSHDRTVRRRTIQYAMEFEWDDEGDYPRNTHPDFENLGDQVGEIKKISRTSTFIAMTDFDEAFDMLLNTQTESTDFLAYGYKKVEELELAGHYGNSKTYKTSLNVLKTYRPYLDFKNITHDLLVDFRDKKKREGLQNSSVHNYLRTLRAIYNSAPRSLKNAENPFNGVFNKIPVKKRRARNRYFDKAQLDQLEKLEMPQESLQRAIDFSLLQFYLCGVDLMDIYYLKKDDVYNGRVFITRKKLGDKGEEFDILLPEKAKKIIDKYADPTKDGYVFPWRKSPRSYKTFRDNHNRALRVVKEREDIVLLPKDDVWTSKVMRHTFATLGKFEHIEEDLLRELMGHERNDIDTVYKDKYPEEARDQAQLQIIDVKVLEEH